MGAQSTKHQGYKRKDRVVVRIRGANKRAEGRVTELGGRGLYVRTDDGKTDFYYWSDVVGPATTAENFLRGRSGLATLGEVVDLSAHMPPRLPPDEPPRLPRRTIVKTIPKREPIPETKVTERPKEEGGRHVEMVVIDDPMPKPKDDKQALVTPQEEPKRRRRSLAKKSMQAHSPTLIGSRFHAERLSRRLSQSDAAKNLGITANLLSRIELGDEKPDDDLLLVFAEKFGVQLEELISLRDKTTWYEEPEVSASAPTNLPPPPPVPEPMPPSVPAPPPPSTEKMFRLLIESTNAELLLNLLHSAQELGLNPKLEKK